MKKFLCIFFIVPCLLAGCSDSGDPVRWDSGTGQDTEAPDTSSSDISSSDTSSSDTSSSDTSSSDTSSSDTASSADVVDEAFWEKIMYYRVSDIDKREMRFGDIVGQNKVTMVNVWGTFCGPCISEMPDIQELYEQYKGKGFGVVGLTCDIMNGDKIDKSALSDALDIKADIGITYPLLIETAELDAKFSTQYVPATFFLDKNGKIIDEGYTGAQSKQEWESIIKKNLNKVK